MHERHPGLTEATASSNSEALRVCLDRHHQSPADFDIINDGQTLFAETNWHPTDIQTRHYKAHDFAQSQAVAYAGLAKAVLPDFAVNQLRTLLETVWAEERQDLRGVEFAPLRVLVSAQGGDVIRPCQPLTSARLNSP